MLWTALKPFKHAHMVFSWDTCMVIEHHGVRHLKTFWKTLIYMYRNRHKYTFGCSYTPTHSGSAKVTVCWTWLFQCSSTVINSLTLWVKNSNPTHSFPSLPLLSPPSRSCSPLVLSVSPFSPQPCPIFAVILPVWLFSASMSFSNVSSLFSSISVTHSLLSSPSSFFLSLLHSTRDTSF